MLVNNEMEKEILKDLLRNHERLEQLNSINKDDIKSIHITLNVDKGDRLEIISIKPMLTKPEISATYDDIKFTSTLMYKTISNLLAEEY